MTQPLYKKVHGILREEIVEGKYKPGDRLPSEKDLSEEYNISRITSRRVMDLLKNEGLIERYPGRGSFVSSDVQGEIFEQTGRKSDNRKRLIGLIITDFSASFGADLVRGIEQAASERGYFLVLRRSFGIPEKEQSAISELLELGVVGLLILPAQAEHFSTDILRLVVNQFPVVLVDRHLRGVATTSVSTDNVAGAVLATQYLLDLGHTHIGIISPPPVDTTTLEERIKGFIRAHAEKGVAVDEELWMGNITCTLPGQFQPENISQDVEAIKAHLIKHPDITALFAVEYNVAILVREAAQQLGRKIPEELSILCFDSPRELLGEHEFTHILQQQELMGKEAVEALLGMANGDTTSKQLLLDAILVEGKSTARIR